MAGRRAPLALVPNAVNSPFRTVTGKRTRTQTGERGEVFPGEPPVKRQAIGANAHNEENIDPKSRTLVAPGSLEKLDSPFSRRSQSTQPTAFEKKLHSAREKKTNPQPRSEKPPKSQAENLETIRQWQKHYRKQFPEFIFYFDNVADDVRAKVHRQINGLGAGVDKFFSKAVTHVVTTRPIPSDDVATSPDEDVKFDTISAKNAQSSLPSQDQRRTTSLIDASLQRRSQPATVNVHTSVDTRRPQLQNADILSRARALRIKIWPLEKLHRVLSTILDTDTKDDANVNESRHHATSARHASKPSQNANLEQLLKNEKVTGPTDRDMTVATQDMLTLRGIYIYVHDMDDTTKPVMARDYPKPPSKDQGKWPQFRLTGAGRCPFVEDTSAIKKLQQAEREASKAKQDSVQRKTRAGATLQTTAPLNKRDANLRRSPRKHTQATHPLDPPKPLALTRQSSEIAPAYFGSAQASFRGLPRMVGGEPVASGVQPSNVTSAIRSQVISSAAISSTAPGVSRRFPDSREVTMLNRKVFERPNNPANASYLINDMRAAINNDRGPPTRAAKRKAQETLGVLHEDDDAGTRSKVRKAALKQSKIIEKEAKPGYCENCRDKFDDFDEHIASRKHRKFALTQENWDELDDLLSKLKRPHKHD